MRGHLARLGQGHESVDKEWPARIPHTTNVQEGVLGPLFIWDLFGEVGEPAVGVKEANPVAVSHDGPVEALERGGEGGLPYEGDGVFPTLVTAVAFRPNFE